MKRIFNQLTTSVIKDVRRGYHSTPGHQNPTPSMEQARELLNGRNRILAITGAGISTDSGIPDYRSPGRPPHRPTSHQQFMASHQTRQRYWARSMAGYETLSHSLPNSGHYALAHSEQEGRLLGIITQNVDLLHEGAGSQNVLHLHGTVEKVRCMSCAALSSRAEFQAQLRRLNASFLAKSTAIHQPDPIADQIDHMISPSLGTTAARVAIPTLQRPDGDADMSHVTDYSSFIIPSCPRCTDGYGQPRQLAHLQATHLPGQPGGILKPELVFFGANVPPEKHVQADHMLAESDAILIAGTSLTVWSAFRLVRSALDRSHPGQASVVSVAEQLSRATKSPASASTGGNSISDGSAILSPITPINVELDPSTSSSLQRVPATIPVIILNHGPTRADQFLSAASWGVYKIEARTGDTLHHLLQVPHEVTRAMEEEVRRKKQERVARGDDTPTFGLEPSTSLLERMKRQENIE